jgi:hypothetical protein
MPASERAAALMHLVYYATIDRPDVEWSSTLPRNWVDLDDRARAFNLAILETWAENPALFELWVEAVRGLISQQRPPRRAKRNRTER